ncbi:hypothetical protein B0H14DRAFT_3503877 [Mycena olivaceomarginata]|nr:hypothetical protein B0H14DRAFT_3503877 [Mycena olivaceomarginata]
MTSSLRDSVSHGQAPPSRPAARTLAYGARAGAQPRPHAGADARTLIPRCPPSRFRLSYTELLLWSYPMTEQGFVCGGLRLDDLSVRERNWGANHTALLLGYAIAHVHLPTSSLPQAV